MANKRERCTNWEKEEKQLLRDILKPYLRIIENKDLSTNTNREKSKAWVEITVRFNTANARIRDKKQLMNQWKCLKLNSKKELSQYKREAAQTGGGPKPPSPSQDTIEITEMIPQEFEVDFNEFDCDGAKDITNEIIQGIEEYKVLEPLNLNSENEEILTTDIIFEVEDETKQRNEKEPQNNDENVLPLLTPKRAASKRPLILTPKESAKKKTSKKINSFNFGEASYADMHKYRALENERLQREHELRVKNMTELQSQVMINLKLQQNILEIMLESHNKKQ